MLLEQRPAAAMADAIRAGKDENEARKPAKASKWSKGPEPPKLLEDPVTIPTAGAPVRGRVATFPPTRISMRISASDSSDPHRRLAGA